MNGDSCRRVEKGVGTRQRITLSADRPVCPRCSLPVQEWLFYCPDCGAPVGAYTLWLPFERIRAYGEFLVRAAKASLKGNGLPWTSRILGALLVFIEAPIVWLMMPFGFIGKGKAAGTRFPGHPQPDPAEE